MKQLVVIFLLIISLVTIMYKTSIAETDHGNSSTSQVTEELSENTKQVEKPTSNQGFYLFDLFKLGGMFMWLLLGFAILSLGFILERLWYFQGHQFNIEKIIRGYINQCKKKGCEWGKEMAQLHPKNDLLQILEFATTKEHLGLDHMEKIIASRIGVVISRLERGLNVLSSIGSLAPLTGFLGTVSGMIAAFRTIANADQVNARMVAGGIFEALITTAFGLIIAIVTISAYNYFVHKIENFTKICEELSSEYLEGMQEN